MNYKQAIKIMSDLVPKNVDWQMQLEHWHYGHSDGQEEVRKIWVRVPNDDPGRFFGNRRTWQSAVDQALVALRDEGLIK